MFEWIDRLGERFGRARQDRDGIGATGRQELVLIDGMTAAPEPCALLTHYHARRHPKRAVAEPKMNGVRGIATPGRIVTRNALPLDAALHCRPLLDRLEEEFRCPMVFDGEYVEHGGLQATLDAVKRGEGFGVFYLFDAVPYDDWKRNRFTHSLSVRRAALVEAMASVDAPFLDLVPQEPVTAGMIPDMAEYIWKLGMEGLVVKDADSPYYRGRSSAWQKVKQQLTREARIMDAIVENGRCKSLLVKLVDNGKTMRVGSNIPEDLRASIGFAPSLWTGRTIELGFTDTNDAGGFTGAYFITLRPDRD